MALIGGHHQDSRFRRNIGGSLPKDYDDLTSNVPFWALISGKQSQGGVNGGGGGGGGSTRLELLSEFYEKEVKGLNLVMSMGMAALYVVRRGR